MDEESEYGLYEDDLESWETEQVFQDSLREREEFCEMSLFEDDARRFGDDFDVDGMGPDFE